MTACGCTPTEILGGRPPDEGNGDCAECIGFHAISDEAQPQVPPNTDTAIRAVQEIFDEGGFYNAPAWTWTPPEGLVTIEAAVTLIGMTGGRSIYAIIYKNSAEFKRGTQVCCPTCTDGRHRSIIAFVDKADGTDTYELYVFHNDVANRTVDWSSEQTYFSGACVGERCTLEG